MRKTDSQISTGPVDTPQTREMMETLSCQIQPSRGDARVCVALEFPLQPINEPKVPEPRFLILLIFSVVVVFLSWPGLDLSSL